MQPRRSRTRSLTIEHALSRAARSGDRSGGSTAAPSRGAAAPAQQQQQAQPGEQQQDNSQQQQQVTRNLKSSNEPLTSNRPLQEGNDDQNEEAEVDEQDLSMDVEPPEGADENAAAPAGSAAQPPQGKDQI